MSGNVSEWCYDKFGKYSVNKEINPVGAPHGNYRIVRGGSWSSVNNYCTSTYRREINPSSENSALGFRICLGPDLKKNADRVIKRKKYRKSKL